jgi:hypothetical protein
MPLTIQGVVQVARGLKANLPAVGADGEMYFCTDTNEMFVGTGTGMSPVSSGSNTGISRAEAIAISIALG